MDRRKRVAITYQKDTSRGLDTNALEELGMSKRKLDKLSDLRHLLSASSNIIVANLVEVALLILAAQRLALAMDNGILGYNAVVRRIKLNHLELYLPHATTDCEQIAHPHWAVGLEEVWLKVDIEERAGETLYGVGNRKHCDAFGLSKQVSYVARASLTGRLTYLMSGQG